MLDAQKKSEIATEKLAIVDYYKNDHNLALNFKVIERMDPNNLEFAYRMLHLDYRLHHAQTTIASIWKGIMCRRIFVKMIYARRRATLFLGGIFRFRLQ